MSDDGGVPVQPGDPDYGVPGATKFTPDVSEMPIPQDTRDTYWNGESWQPHAPAPDLQTQLRGAGNSWRDIDDHIAGRTEAALQAGYDQTDVDRQILGFRDPAGFVDRAKQGWAAAFGVNPDLLNGLAGPQPELDLTQSPTLAGDYSRAVLDRAIKGPQDFAEHYAAAAIDAAHEALGIDNSNLPAARSLQAAGATAADALAPTLPSPRDLTDAGLYVGGALDQAKRNLLDHWAETGEGPADAAARANASAGIASKLTASQAPAQTSLDRFLQTVMPTLNTSQMRLQWPSVTDAFKAALAGAKLPFQSDPSALNAGLQNFYRAHPGPLTAAMSDLVSTGEIGVRGVMAGLNGLLAGGYSLLDQVLAAHPDDPQEAARVGLSLMNSFPMGLRGSVGAIPPFVRAPVVNLAKPPGEAVVEMPLREALAPVVPAERQARPATPAPEPPEGLSFATPQPTPAPSAAPRLVAPPRPQDLFQFLRERGGLKPDEGGELRAMDLHKLKGFARVVRNDGMTLDEGREAATEAGYLHPDSDLNDLLSALHRQQSGTPVFNPSDPLTADYEAFERARRRGEFEIPFPESATPAQKIEALAREAEGQPARSFAEVAAKEDPATQALAAGHDTTASAMKWFDDFAEVFKDQAGSFTFPQVPSELEAGSRAARILGKNTAEDMLRSQANGLGTQRTNALAYNLEQFFKDFAPHMPEWRAALRDNPQLAAETTVGKALDAIQGRGVMAPDAPLAPFAKWWAQEEGRQWAEIQAHVARGDIPEVAFRDHYLPYVVDLSDEGRAGTAGRTGSLGFIRQRQYETITDLLRDGHRLKYDHPLLNILAAYKGKSDALATLRMQAMAREANWMRYYMDSREAARDGFKRVFGLGSEKFASTIDKETGEPGPVVHQQLYAPAGFSNIWNNWTGYTGKVRDEGFSSIDNALLKIKNGSTYAKLLFPGFHTITEYKNGLNAGLANAIVEGLKGLRTASPGEFMRGLRDAALSPVKPFQYVFRSGPKYRRMYRAMESDPALDAFIAGGGNIASRERIYASGDTPTIWRSMRRGQLGQEMLDDLLKATFPRTREGGLETSAKDFAIDLANVPMLPLREIGRIMTSLTAPVWDHMVPLLKAGAAIERIQTFLRQNPGANDEAVRWAARQIVQNIEDRFGEYNSANLFWKPGLKRIANQTMLSTGWKYGTIHATLAGLRWNPGRGLEWNPYATSMLAAQVATVAFTNAAWSLLIDGHLPDNKLDYMIPFANMRGLFRLLLPGEEKEFYDWLKIATDTDSLYRDKGPMAAIRQFFGSTGGYAVNALAPVWRSAIEWMLGETAIGKRIGYGDETFKKWFADSFAPIFITNWEQAQKAGLNPIENLFGLRVAPKWFSNWDEWRQGQVRLHNLWDRQAVQRARREAGIPSLPRATAPIRRSTVRPADRPAQPNIFGRPRRTRRPPSVFDQLRPQ